MEESKDLTESECEGYIASNIFFPTKTAISNNFPFNSDKFFKSREILKFKTTF